MNLFTVVSHAVPPGVKPVFDVVAISTSIGAIVGALTSVIGLLAALASFAWALVRLYETKTVQGWLSRRRRK